MKKYATIAITLGLLLGTCSLALAVSGGDTFITQRDPTNTFNTTNILPYPSGAAAVTFDPVTNIPVYGVLGSGLSFSDATQNVTVANVPEASITNLTTDLAGKFNTPTGTTSQYVEGNGTLGTTPSAPVAYDGTTQRTNAFPIFLSTTVASGVGVANLTADGTSGGVALCTNGVITNSVGLTVSDATASYQMSYAFSNSNKTITITTNKLTTANILTGILGQSAANGAVVKVSVWCY